MSEKENFNWDMFAEKVLILVFALIPLFLSGFGIAFMVLSPDRFVEDLGVTIVRAVFVLVILAVLSTCVSGFLIHRLIEQSGVIKEKEPTRDNGGDNGEVRTIKFTNRHRIEGVVVIEKRGNE